MIFKIHMFKGNMFNRSFLLQKRIKCFKTFNEVWLRYSMNSERD